MRRKVPEFMRHDTRIVLVVRGGLVVSSLEDRGDVEAILRRLTVKVGGRRFVRLTYPTTGQLGFGQMDPTLDVEGTMAHAALIAVDQIEQAWTQSRHRRPTSPVPLPTSAPHGEDA